MFGRWKAGGRVGSRAEKAEGLAKTDANEKHACLPCGGW